MAGVFYGRTCQASWMARFDRCLAMNHGIQTEPCAIKPIQKIKFYRVQSYFQNKFRSANAFGEKLNMFVAGFILFHSLLVFLKLRGCGRGPIFPLTACFGAISQPVRQSMLQPNMLQLTHFGENGNFKIFRF